MFRDHDFLDRRTLDAVAGVKSSGALVFNAWHEAWGDHRWFPADVDDTQAAGFAVMSGAPADGIFRINSRYPADGFWWDSQLRITPAFPAEPHFLEQFAHAVAELDPLRITRGGLFMDKSHTEEIRRFARAFRALPARKFHDVGETTDPVVVRALHEKDRSWLYLVNREYYPVRMSMQYEHGNGRVTDAATGEKVEARANWKVALGPYELRVFILPADSMVMSTGWELPSDIEQKLESAADDALRAFDEARSRGAVIPGMDELETEIRAARDDVDNPRPAWLRRALTSYIVRKAYERAGRESALLKEYVGE